MICSRCIVPMKHVLRFVSGGGAYELYRCPKCSFESRAVPYSMPKEIRQNKTKNANNRRKRNRNVQRIYHHYQRDS